MCMIRILSNKSKPINFEPSKLTIEMTVEFVYNPLIGKRREYQCEVVSTNKRDLVALVLKEYPIALTWSVHSQLHKKFAFKRMEIYNVSPYQEYRELSISQLAKLCLGKDGNYMDEHGNIR